MPLIPASLKSILTWLSPARKNSLECLPNDVLVDVVIPHLDVRDILQLRQVNKFFYHLTHHAVIWKRLLQASTLPLPPLPPSSRHALDNITALEAESLFIRAHSLDRVWKQNTPEANLYRRWTFNSDCRIAEMVILPGGRYLVASVSDAAMLKWEVRVFVMDDKNHAAAVASFDTKTKAYNLQAKYLTVGGVRNLVIAYVRRDWKRTMDRSKGINVSLYSSALEHDIDAPYPLKHECRVWYVSLQDLDNYVYQPLLPGSDEYIDAAKALPQPFQEIVLVRSNSRQLGPIVLDDFLGEPYICVVKYPCTIVFKPLHRRPASTLNVKVYPEFAVCEHRIMAIRPLPQQGQILLVRKIELEPHCSNSFEIYDIPINNAEVPFEVSVDPGASIFLANETCSNVYISDHGTPVYLDETTVQLEEKRGVDVCKPRPLTVFLSAVTPRPRMCSFTLTPERVDEPSPLDNPEYPSSHYANHHYRYSLDATSTLHHLNARNTLRYRVLPGLRSMVYTIPADDLTDSPRIWDLYKYDDSHQPDGAVLATDLATKVLPVPIAFQPDEKISAVAWDGAIGRVCFARANTQEVLVLDFTKAPLHDTLGRRLPLLVHHEHALVL